MKYRYLASAILGLILFAIYIWRFLPYSERMRPEHAVSWWPFLAVLFIAGLALTLGVARGRFRVCNCLLLTMFAANIVLIVIDCIPDRTNHNLMPFEFLFIAVLTLPMYLGAALAAGIGRLRGR